jgi:hypothetical protein
VSVLPLRLVRHAFSPVGSVARVAMACATAPILVQPQLGLTPEYLNTVAPWMRKSAPVHRMNGVGNHARWKETTDVGAAKGTCYL